MRRVTIHKFMYIVTRLISDVHFHITGSKLTFKTYNYRYCDTSMSPKTADYFPPGGVIATLLGNCKVLCYANMNITLFRVSANQITVFSITQQSRYLFIYELSKRLRTDLGRLVGSITVSKPVWLTYFLKVHPS